MTLPLRDAPGRLLAFDARLDRAEAAARMPQGYSVWPERHWGCSADPDVWPSVFAREGETDPDRIRLPPLASRMWEAFGLFDDIDELSAHLRPVRGGGEVIALALDAESAGRAPADVMLGALEAGPPARGAGDMPARSLGYDVTDPYLTSMILNAGPTPALIEKAPARSAAGLIEDAAAARAYLPVLEAADPSHVPLLVVEVYSLGAVPVLGG